MDNMINQKGMTLSNRLCSQAEYWGAFNTGVAWTPGPGSHTGGTLGGQGLGGGSGRVGE